jgi:MerR family transcriptional regulator/heat shock protein HspR
MDDIIGVYVMQVASTMTGMHPQTLRKYERAGFLEPSRRYNARIYSNDDIYRLKMIKRLVDDEGLNIAGVGLALRLRDKIIDTKEEIISSKMGGNMKDRFTELLDDMLVMLGNGGE